jgi:hypothetical protein
VSAAAIVVAALILVLAAIGFAPSLLAQRRERRARRRAPRAAAAVYDPGRERRAERRAAELLGSIVSSEEYAMYRELGFLSVDGGAESANGRATGPSGYAYLICPHRPIVAYDTETGELLSEYCVGFPDPSESSAGPRLPDADDVLAKWMSLRAGERELIAIANMHVPGRQVDPGQVRRDLHRLREWRARRRRVAA